MDTLKVFHAPSDEERFIAFFCIEEDKKYFHGYLISKEKGNYSIKLNIGTNKNPEIVYIICDSIYSISKTIRLDRLFLNYSLNQLRDTASIIRAGGAKTRCLDGRKFKLKNPVCNPQQLANRRNSRNHEQLHDLKQKEELAGINNDIQAKKRISQKIDSLTYSMGYQETASVREACSFAERVTNPKPLPGGSCTPK